MNSLAAATVAAWLDDQLGVAGFPDYPAAFNGLQLDHRGPVVKVAGAVDFSRRTIDAAIASRANFLLLHHGMFWGGPQRLTGPWYERVRALIEHDIAVYAAHLPLDAHPEHGNCALLARRLGLEPDGRFGEYQGVSIGVRGATDLPVSELLARAQAFAAEHGGSARVTPGAEGARCRRWAVVTGAGADTASLRQARTAGIDTLIVGEGPHHTTVDAAEHGLAIIYAGHYATETLGVQALLQLVHAGFGVSTEFLPLPTGS